MSTNPNKIPVSKKFAEKEYQRGRHEGLESGVYLMLYVLIEKRGMDREEATSLGRDLEYVCASINGGYISWRDVETMLHEYDVEVNLT